MKRDLPDFYIDPNDHVLKNCRRGPRAKFFRRLYRSFRSATVIVPVVIAVIGIAAYVWNEHSWRQASVADRVQIEMLRNQVKALQDSLAGPKTVCRFGSSGRESCIRIHPGV